MGNSNINGGILRRVHERSHQISRPSTFLVKGQDAVSGISQSQRLQTWCQPTSSSASPGGGRGPGGLGGPGTDPVVLGLQLQPGLFGIGRELTQAAGGNHQDHLTSSADSQHGAASATHPWDGSEFNLK